MTLFEIYYHDPWRTHSSYSRQYIASSEKDAMTWLLRHKNDWLEEAIDPDPSTYNPIDFVNDAIAQTFRNITITEITVHDNGTVEWG